MIVTTLLLILGLCAHQIMGQDGEAPVFQSNLTRAASSSLPSQCGFVPQDRVIGGNVAPAHKHPWAAALYIQKVVKGRRKTSFCGATLISDRWLVTAARCVDDARQVAVRAGCSTLNQCEANVLARQWIIHPWFNKVNSNSDIALVLLRRPLKLSNKIQPACLPGPPLTDNRGITVIGWGPTSNNGQGSGALKEGVMVTKGKSDCLRAYSSFNYRTMVCATPGSASVCSGDFGSSVGRVFNGRFQMDGVTSFLFPGGCNQGPSGFVRVKTYVPWIQANV